MSYYNPKTDDQVYTDICQYGTCEVCGIKKRRAIR